MTFTDISYVDVRLLFVRFPGTASGTTDALLRDSCCLLSETQSAFKKTSKHGFNY
jgi:hypothetical protein